MSHVRPNGHHQPLSVGMQVVAVAMGGRREGGVGGEPEGILRSGDLRGVDGVAPVHDHELRDAQLAAPALFEGAAGVASARGAAPEPDAPPELALPPTDVPPDTMPQRVLGKGHVRDRRLVGALEPDAVRWFGQPFVTQLDQPKRMLTPNQRLP